MRHEPGGGAWSPGRYPARFSHQQRRPVPQGLHRRRIARRARPADRAAGARAQGRRLACGELGPGARPHRRRPARDPGRATAPTPSACSAAAASPTKRPTCSASSRGWRCGPPTSTTTAASACPRPPRRACARSGSIAACRSRCADIPGAEAILLVGGNPAETMPPLMQYFEEQRAAAAAHRRRSRANPPPPSCASLHLQITPGTDAALANGLLHVAISDGLDRRRLHRRAHLRLRPGPPHRRILLARARRAHHRRAGAQDRSSAAPLWGRRRPPWCSPGAAPSSRATASTTCSPSSTWRWRSARPASRSAAMAA